MKKLQWSALICALLVILTLSACAKSNGQGATEQTESATNTQLNNYHYINGFATFRRSDRGGIITFADPDSTDNGDYSGKVRWKSTDSKNAPPIVSAAQVLTVDGKVANRVELKIETAKSDTWDHLVSYEPRIQAKGSAKATAECYILLTDRQGTEYRVMLTPNADQPDDYTGAAVYIIDHTTGRSFWYDDLLQ